MISASRSLENRAGEAPTLETTGTASTATRNGVSVAAEGRVEGQSAAAEAILAAYRKHGTECARHTPGTYAFVVSDETQGSLVAGSSLTSRNPLSFWSDGRNLRLSSSMLGVLRDSRVSRSLDELHLAHAVLGTGLPPVGTTCLADVRRLQAGEVLIARGRALRFERPDRLTPAAVAARSLEEAVEAFWHLLDRVLPGNAQACLSLSGGLDSTLLGAALARKRNSLDAFAIVASDRASIDESAPIASFERAYPRVHVQRVDCRGPAELPDLTRLELRGDPPLTPLSLLPARLRLWKAAGATGHRLLIDGEGGDELFGTLLSPLRALRQGDLRTLWRHLRSRPHPRSLLWRALVMPLLPEPLRRRLLRRWTRDTHEPPYLAGHVADRPVLKQAVEQYYAAFVHKDLEAMLPEWLSWPELVGSTLAHRQMAAAHGLELSSPLLDRRMLEFVLGLPVRFLLPMEVDKAFLREATRERLPEDIRTRPKDARLADAFAREIVVSPRARDVFRNDRVRKRLADWIRFDRLESLLDAIARGYPPSDTLLWQLERLLAFAEWYARASREYGVD